MGLLVAPLVATIGIIATIFVLRARWRARTTLYQTVRKERVRRIEEARKHLQQDGKPVSTPVPAELVEVGADEVPRERLWLAVVGNLSLAAALLVVLLGVLLAVSQAR